MIATHWLASEHLLLQAKILRTYPDRCVTLSTALPLQTLSSDSSWNATVVSVFALVTVVEAPELIVTVVEAGVDEVADEVATVVGRLACRMARYTMR